MKKIVAAMAVMAVFFLLLCFVSVGQTEETAVVSNISPFALENVTTYNLFDFSETNDGWDCDGVECDVTLAETIPVFPFEPLTGDGALIVRVPNAQNAKKYSVSKNYVSHLDLSQFNSLLLTVNCNDVGADRYNVSVELYSDDDVFTSYAQIQPLGWSCVFADISGWQGRSGVKKICVTLSLAGDIDNNSDYELYIDSVRLSNHANAYSRVAFSADSYRVSGAAVLNAGKYLDISGVGDEAVVTSNGFAYENIGRADSIKVDFKTDGLCTGVGMRVNDKEGNNVSEEYVSVSAHNGDVSVCLPIKHSSPSEIELFFEGVSLGNVRIYGVKLYSSVAEPQSDEGIDTCAVNANTEEIIIKGTLSHNLLNEYLQKEIYLFANDFCDKVTPEMLSEQAWIEKNTVLSQDFIFRVRYKGVDEGRSSLFKMYTVAVKLETGYRIIGNSECITNPDAFAGGNVVPPLRKSGKGVYGESISFMQEVGVSDTLVWVDMGKFFVPETANGSKFECGGYVFGYDQDYFSVIDSMINNFADKKIDVTVVFVVSDSGNDALNRSLIHKDADLSALYCANNTSDRQGIAYIRAVSEFFASKYVENNCVTRFVFGDSVGNCSRNYNMGEKTLAEFTEEYAVGFRTVFNAVRSYSPYVKVYTYIDGVWNSGLAFDEFTRYDNKAFLDSFSNVISRGGNVDWSLAHNPYPADVYNYYAYSDMKLDNNYFTPRVGFRNIGVIVNYLKNAELLYNNSERECIVIEQSRFSGVDEQQITADYIYNCYKALNTSVSAYITDRNCNYNNAMKYVDTSLSLTASGFVSDVLGVATWESVVEGFDGRNIEKRKIQNGALQFSQPKHKGSVAFSDFSNDTVGWERYGFTEKMTAGAALNQKSGLLSLFLGDIPAGESRGVEKKFDAPLDLSKMSVLSFEVNIASLPTNVDYASLSVILTSGNDYIELSGKVKEASWTNICCDFSSFTGITKVDSVKILFYAEENYYDSPQAFISSMRLLSKDYTDQELAAMMGNNELNSRLTTQIKYYLYPLFFVLALMSTLIFIRRRTAKIKK